MNDRTRDLNDLEFFVQVVDHGGFAPAGRALGVPKSRLSRRIALLEERLGVRLIQRSTRRFVVTEAGRTYYAHCRAMLAEADAADEAIARNQAEPRGVVRIACPVALVDAYVGRMAGDFLVRYPQVELHLEATNRRVDVVGEGIDIALRVRPPPLPDSDLVMRVLGDRGQCLLASPALLAGGGPLESPVDLARFPSLALGTSEGEYTWNLHGPDAAQASIHHHPRLVSGSMSALRAAAIAGVGVVQLPRMVVRDALADGEIVCVLPDWLPRREIIHAVFASRRGMVTSVRALLDFLADRFAAIDDD